MISTQEDSSSGKQGRAPDPKQPVRRGHTDTQVWGVVQETGPDSPAVVGAGQRADGLAARIQAGEGAAGTQQESHSLPEVCKEQS